jgi:hypothetical protein
MSESTAGINLSSGDVDGALGYFDYLVDKNLMTASAVSPVKSAFRQVFQTVERNGPIETIKVTDSFDPDEYFGRFEVAAKSSGRFAPDSIRAYRSRFIRGLNMYRNFLATGQAPKPSTRSTSPRTRSASAPSVTSSVSSSDGNAVEVPVETGEAMVAYPFPLESGEMAHLRLPKHLGKRDAARISAFINSLVIEFEAPKAIERVTGQGDHLAAAS